MCFCKFKRVFTTSSTTESSLQTIPPGVLSHFIPGDTPTLYAGTKAPITTPTPSPPHPSVYTRQPSSAFTFFGMPLPSIGSFWGAGRDSDGRGRFTSNRGRGRVQQLPPAMHDGFRPMLPHSSGGFRPIFNPYNESTSGPGLGPGSGEEFNSHSQSLSLESLPYNHSDWDNSLGLPHASVSKVPPPGKYKPSGALEVVTSSEEEDNHRPSPWDTNLSEPLLESGGVGGGSDEFPHPPPTFPPLAPPTTSIEDVAFAISLPESSRTGGTNSTKPNTMSASIIIQDDQRNKSGAASTSTTTSTGSFLSDLWGSVGNKGKGPTSLSEFLAPGAQLPPAKPPGRPTITKVTVTPPLGPGPAPMAEDLQGPYPRLAKSPPHHYYTTQHHNVKNDSMSWYYSNYNKSELEPYVGPGRGTAGAGRASAGLMLCSELLLTLNVVVFLLAS